MQNHEQPPQAQGVTRTGVGVTGARRAVLPHARPTSERGTIRPIRRIELVNSAWILACLSVPCPGGHQRGWKASGYQPIPAAWCRCKRAQQARHDDLWGKEPLCLHYDVSASVR